MRNHIARKIVIFENVVKLLSYEVSKLLPFWQVLKKNNNFGNFHFLSKKWGILHF